MAVIDQVPIAALHTTGIISVGQINDLIRLLSDLFVADSIVEIPATSLLPAGENENQTKKRILFFKTEDSRLRKKIEAPRPAGAKITDALKNEHFDRFFEAFFYD